jgi:hypothetical protein
MKIADYKKWLKKQNKKALIKVMIARKNHITLLVEMILKANSQAEIKSLKAELKEQYEQYNAILSENVKRLS